MAVLRTQNWLGQQRVDQPHLRLIEAGVEGDFDALCGEMLAGGTPRILKGFTIVGVSGAASALSLRVTGGRVIHPTASDSGSVYVVPEGEADEVLGPSNGHVDGSFVPNQANFVGLDLHRLADDTTSDIVMFLGASTLTDSPRKVPLGRTLTRRIVITTLDPDSTTGLAPIAKIVTDVANNVVSITDIRSRLFRLGSGGGVPDSLHIFSWPAGRSDSTDFTEPGDKQIGDLKTWSDAIMTRIWELGGGERWFSPTADRNVTLTGIGTTFFGGDYLEWTGTNLHWRGLAVLFDNSTGEINEIADQLTDSPGLTDLADGECIYVDLDRTQNRTGGSALVSVRAPLTSLGIPTVPGSRLVIAWRRGAQAYYRGRIPPISTILASSVATTLLQGTVQLSGTPAVALAPVAGTLNAASRLMAAGLTRAAGVVGAGTGAALGNGVIAIAPDTTTDTGVTYGNISMTGEHVFDGAGAAAEVILIRNNTDRAVTPVTKVARWQQNDGGIMKDVLSLLGAGALEIPLRLAVPSTPSTDVAVISFRTNGLASPNRRLQLCVLWPDGTEGVILESAAS